jgi:hypothetical protein
MMIQAAFGHLILVAFHVLQLITEGGDLIKFGQTIFCIAIHLFQVCPPRCVQ